MTLKRESLEDPARIAEALVGKTVRSADVDPTHRFIVLAFEDDTTLYADDPAVYVFTGRDA